MIFTGTESAGSFTAGRGTFTGNSGTRDNAGLQLQRAISIQAEEKKLLKKHAIAPSAARLCYAAALMAKGLLHPSRVINTRIGVARITTPYSCNREPQATSQTIFSEGIGGIA